MIRRLSRMATNATFHSSSSESHQVCLSATVRTGALCLAHAAPVSDSARYGFTIPNNPELCEGDEDETPTSGEAKGSAANLNLTPPRLTL